MTLQVVVVSASEVWVCESEREGVGTGRARVNQ